MPNNRPRSTASNRQQGTPNTQSKTKPTNAASKSQGAKKSQGANKKSAASQRFAERQARKEQAASEARRARNRRWGLISIGLVVVIVAALVIVKVAGSGSSGSDHASPPRGTPIPAATLSKLASVPMSTLAAAPTGGLTNQITATKGPALTSNGKSELLFVGAEYCPHCGAERWAMYMALSKFGKFSPNPGKIHSATQDGNVPTLTFYGTTYSSPYFTFTPVEVYTNQLNAAGTGYVPLQKPTKAQAALWQNLGQGSFPFLDFAGKGTLVGAQYSYLPMQNLPFSDVAAQVGNNKSEIGANIDASAFQLVKSICHSLSSSKPASVCSAAGA